MTKALKKKIMKCHLLKNCKLANFEKTKSHLKKC